MKRTMTIHAGLSYVKNAQKRIDKALETGTFVTYAKNGADKINGELASKVREDVKSSYQSVCDIIKTVEAIKRAISEANAEYTIFVCGEEMTVAEAIYMMNYGIATKKELLETMRRQYASAKRSVEKFNGDDLEKRADQFITSIYGNKEKATGTDALSAREAFKKQHSYELVDPIGVLSEINALEKWIADFEAEVDGAIQVSNATHTITIDV